MDLESKKFGKGPKELTGAVDLVQYYKLFPHYEFFCKKTSLSVLDAHYLHNVVGDKEIRKGEGMQLNQLINDNKSISQEAIHPFDLNALGDAFHLRETAPIELPDVRKFTILFQRSILPMKYMLHCSVLPILHIM
ncbi:putative mediator complex, subunit Med19, metazoa [Helianthus annuus]|nr:putative mediator complex, subunit Med19, metazoa [Helianthus annuus]